MKISNKYQIISDSLNIILQERFYNKKQKTHYWKNIAYFATSHNALDYLIENEIRGTGFEDLNVLVSKIDELYKMIDSLCKSNRVPPKLVQST